MYFTSPKDFSSLKSFHAHEELENLSSAQPMDCQVHSPSDTDSVVVNVFEQQNAEVTTNIVDQIALSPEDRAKVEALSREDSRLRLHAMPAPEDPHSGRPTPSWLLPTIEQYADVFPSKLPPGLPKARPTDNKIDIKEGSKPPSHRVYRMTPDEDKELLKQLKSYLAAGQIEPSVSPYGAGVLFVT